MSAHRTRPPFRPLRALLLCGALLSCSAEPATAPDEVELPHKKQPAGPQTLVLIATPKMIADFGDPDDDVARFLDHYAPLTSRAVKTIVVFAVGNSEHILQYRGPDYWDDPVSWARYTGFRRNPVSDQRLDYHQVAGIVRAFRDHAASTGIELAVFDQIDAGREFTETRFKDQRHPECLDADFEHTFDIRGSLTADGRRYASAPDGIEEGTLCGHFLVDQVVHYVRDLGFDGIMYGNQLGTRGHWLPENGPGYTAEEAAAIRDFMAYSESVLQDKDLMWFDSYLPVHEERASFSFPDDGYRHFDYLIAAGFCVITFTERYIANLESKLALGQTRVLATLDYVDPWYDYDSMIDYPIEAARLEEIAIDNRHRIAGFVFFANDHWGDPVPRGLIESFAERFFEDG